MGLPEPLNKDLYHHLIQTPASHFKSATQQGKPSQEVFISLKMGCWAMWVIQGKGGLFSLKKSKALLQELIFFLQKLPVPSR